MKFFNKWDSEKIKINDPGLKDYINVEPKIVPVSGGRNAKQRFHKSKATIVERLVNKIMVPGHKAKKHKRSSGHICGRNTKAMLIVKNAFEIIESKTKKNPVTVLVKAVDNSAPREEIVAIEYGGARYPRAVECSPQRRIDLVLRYITQGAYSKSFKSKKSIEQCLADEIIAASTSQQNSNAISKKNELERQADASR